MISIFRKNKKKNTDNITEIPDVKELSNKINNYKEIKEEKYDKIFNDEYNALFTKICNALNNLQDTKACTVYSQGFYYNEYETKRAKDMISRLQEAFVNKGYSFLYNEITGYPCPTNNDVYIQYQRNSFGYQIEVSIK